MVADVVAAAGRRRQGAVLPAVGTEPVRPVALTVAGGGTGRRPRGSRRRRRRGRLGRRHAVRVRRARLGSPPARPQTVLVRSFSKTHGPDLRLAAIGGPARWSTRSSSGATSGRAGAAGSCSRSCSTCSPTSRRGRSWRTRRRRTPPGRRRWPTPSRNAGSSYPGRDGINVWVPVAEQGAALLHLAAAGVRAASGDPFWISTPDRPHPDHHRLDRRRLRRPRRPGRGGRPRRHLVRPPLTARHVHHSGSDQPVTSRPPITNTTALPTARTVATTVRSPVRSRAENPWIASTCSVEAGRWRAAGTGSKLCSISQIGSPRVTLHDCFA